MSSPTLVEADRSGPEANISRLKYNDKTTDGMNRCLGYLASLSDFEPTWSCVCMLSDLKTIWGFSIGLSQGDASEAMYS